MSAKMAGSSTFKEELLYNLPPGYFKVEATWDRRHSLALARADGRVRWFWDGRPGEPFDEIMPTAQGQLFH